MVVMILLLFIHNPNVMANCAIVALFGFLFLSGASWKQSVLLLLPFLLISVMTANTMILYGQGKTIWWQWAWISISRESFYRGVHIGLRALVYALLGMWFALTTRPVALFYSLMQQLRLNPKYAYSFIVGFRLIPIMFEEFHTIRMALKVRGFDKQRGWNRFYLTMQAYAIPLLSQSIRRAHRVAVAMEAKRFAEREKRTYYYVLRLSWRDVLFGVMVVGAIWAIGWWSGHFPYVSVTDVH